MADDILNRVRRLRQDPELAFVPEIYNEALVSIEDLCLAIANKSLVQLGMHAPDRSALDTQDRDLVRGSDLDVGALAEFVETNVPLLLPEQLTAYKTIMSAIANRTGGLFFLDAPGGTGKTFLISLILATIRSRKHIASAIASSGIAAALLDGGRTAHSALKLPLNVQTIEMPTCNLTKNSGMGTVLRTCRIIIWDECKMAHKKSLEALDRSLRDFRDCQVPFGGALIMLSGDSRQTLPVIPRGTRADEINACLKQSTLWRHVQKLTLTTNMRVQLRHDTTAARFAAQLLDISSGRMPIDRSSQSITLPSDFCTMCSTKERLIQSVLPDIERNFRNRQWLSKRAILAAKSYDVNAMNLSIKNTIPGEA
ncbi:uncharacterized protein LOC100901484 [Galendromus occidentalis]|uniref:ATP-dependent DNA helicase n=1 Tax=Galendromus occidentalis TaxID=34638 RepID=A0AAJ6QNW8_9ACAR|nr:uncharacterized protein LOC100901484 [Galendromus occidentalis]